MKNQLACTVPIACEEPSADIEEAGIPLITFAYDIHSVSSRCRVNSSRLFLPASIEQLC